MLHFVSLLALLQSGAPARSAPPDPVVIVDDAVGIRRAVGGRVDAVFTRTEWGFVALKAPEAFKSLQYRAPSDCWGDVGAAFGALAAILAVQSYARGYARGPRSLVLAGSDGGLRGAMLLLDPRTL